MHFDYFKYILDEVLQSYVCMWNKTKLLLALNVTEMSSTIRGI